MNSTETGRVLRILRTIWPDAIVNEDTVTAWTWAFEDVPYELVEDAAKRWIKTGRFFPKPAELLKTIGVQTVAPNLIPEAAWADVLSEVRRVGFNRLPVFANGRFHEPERPSFSHPLIAEAVAAVGWETICTSDKPEVVRSQFVKTLQALMDRAVERQQTGDGRTPLPAGSIRMIDKGAAD